MQKRKKTILLIMFYSLAITFYCQYKGIFSKYYINADVNEYIFPFYLLKDPTLFQNDFFVKYWLAYNSKGMIALYSLFSKFFDPLLFTKILPFILCPMSSIFMFLIGERIRNTHVGLLAAVFLTLYSWTICCYSGGHARAFSFPLLLGFLFYLISKRYYMLPLIIFLQIMIYPPAALIAITTIFVLITFNSSRSYKIITSQEMNTLICIFIIAFLFLSFIYSDALKTPGQIFDYTEMKAMPEFHVGGRTPVFYDSLCSLKVEKLSENVLGLSIFRFPCQVLLGAAFISMLGIFLFRIKTPSILNLFCISSLIVYILSWMTLAHLYLPGRYLKIAFPIYFILLFSIAADHFISCFETKKLRNTLRTVLLLLINIIYFPYFHEDLQHYQHVGLYNYLSCLPKNALIAGNPNHLSEIRTYSKRSVFLEHDLSHPHFRNVYQEIKRRTREAFLIYYSSSLNEIVDLCRKNAIDYLVVMKEDFSNLNIARGKHYRIPFNDEIKGVIQRNKGAGFALMKVPKDLRLYEDEQFYVVKINDVSRFLKSKQ
jgi:hypothetical protein